METTTKITNMAEEMNDSQHQRKGQTRKTIKDIFQRKLNYR